MFVRTEASHPDFRDLVKWLDQELADRDGEDHAFYHQFNTIEALKHVVVLYKDNVPVGCGAIKKFNDTSAEVKRMFVKPDFRGQGLASVVLKELELWASELGFSACVLETGKKQPEAIALYKKNGYAIIPNYGQYIGIENSVCFKKAIC